MAVEFPQLRWNLRNLFDPVELADLLVRPLIERPGASPSIGHRQLRRAHLGEHLLGRHAAVHQPDPARLAVLSLDALEKPSQRRVLSAMLPGSTS